MAGIVEGGLPYMKASSDLRVVRQRSCPLVMKVPLLLRPVPALRECRCLRQHPLRQEDLPEHQGELTDPSPGLGNLGPTSGALTCLVSVVLRGRLTESAERRPLPSRVSTPGVQRRKSRPRAPRAVCRERCGHAEGGGGAREGGGQERRSHIQCCCTEDRHMEQCRWAPSRVARERTERDGFCLTRKG